METIGRWFGIVLTLLALTVALLGLLWCVRALVWALLTN